MIVIARPGRLITDNSSLPIKSLVFSILKQFKINSCSQSRKNCRIKSSQMQIRTAPFWVWHCRIRNDELQDCEFDERVQI